MTIPVKDIDVNINTNEKGITILNRWLQIVPVTYSAQYDVNYPIGIFNLNDVTGKELSFDVFVNEDHILYREQIGAFHVERLDKMIEKLYSDLLGRKREIEFLQVLKSPHSYNLPELLEKYNRMLNRLQLLVKCYDQRTKQIPNM